MVLDGAAGDRNDLSGKEDEAAKQMQNRGPMLRKRQHSLAANIVPFHERDRAEFLTIVFGGSALAFNSGFINGCTLLTFHPQPVSHVTGTTSHAGIDLASGNYNAFGVEVTLIVCFISGAAITGYWMPANAFQLGRQYGPLFLIGSGLLLFACLTSYFVPDSNWYFYFASMASGLQNGMTTKYSGSIIRTTHLTGAATDIGLTLGRLLMGEYKDLWKLQVLLPIFMSFFTGGFLSKYAVRRLGKLSLMVNVLIFFSVGLAYSIFVSYSLEISLLSAFLGSYRTAGQKLKNATEKFDVKEKVKTALYSANAFRSTVHSKMKNLKPKSGNKNDSTGKTKKTSEGSEAQRGDSPSSDGDHGDLEAPCPPSTFNPLHDQ